MAPGGVLLIHIGDPGDASALVVLDDTGALVGVHDTPTLTLRLSRGTRQEYDMPGQVALLVTPFGQ